MGLLDPGNILNVIKDNLVTRISPPFKRFLLKLDLVVPIRLAKPLCVIQFGLLKLVGSLFFTNFTPMLTKAHLKAV